MKIENI